jgi:hypothetical protein
MGKFRDLTGQTFGQLRVLERVENNKHGNAMWRCVCSGNGPACRGDTRVRSNSLLRREYNTQSCGCLVASHGHTRNTRPSPEYVAWIGMKARCHNLPCGCIDVCSMGRSI